MARSAEERTFRKIPFTSGMYWKRSFLARSTDNFQPKAEAQDFHPYYRKDFNAPLFTYTIDNNKRTTRNARVLIKNPRL